MLTNMNPQSTTNTPQPLLTLIAVVLVVISMVLVLLTLFGYGTLKVSAPAGSVVTVNGHTLKDTSVKLRPGTYDVVVAQYAKEPSRTKVSIKLLGTSTVAPAMTQKDPSALVASLIGSYGGYGIPVVTGAKWFEGNTWMAATVGPGGSSQIALHYVDQQWKIAYFDGLLGYPSDKNTLPEAVANHLEEQAALYAN